VSHSCSLGHWVVDILVDAADAGPACRAHADLDIAVVTPAGAPGVLNEPVSTVSGVSAIADSKDGVVDGGSASGGGNNTTGVLLEDSLISFDGNRVWLDHNSGLHKGVAATGIVVSSGALGVHDAWGEGGGVARTGNTKVA